MCPGKGLPVSAESLPRNPSVTHSAPPEPIGTAFGTDARNAAQKGENRHIRHFSALALAQRITLLHHDAGQRKDWMCYRPIWV